MQVIKTPIPDVIEFQPKVFGDERGYFVETFRQDIFEQTVGKVHFVQDNESMSSYGVLRGLHFQRPPFTQSKLVRAIQGKVLDVAVDIRLGSLTYGQHVAVVLDSQKKNQLWVPQGFAHGFVVLSETAVFAYKCDNYYTPDHDGGCQWNDPQLNIDWMIPHNDVKLSQKDEKLPRFESVKAFMIEEFNSEKVYK